MPDQIRAALSVGVHALVGVLVAVLVARGVDIPAGWTAPIESALLAVAVAGYAGLVHLCGLRADTRWIGKLLTFGLGPVVPAPAPVPQIVADLRARAAERQTPPAGAQ